MGLWPWYNHQGLMFLIVNVTGVGWVLCGTCTPPRAFHSSCLPAMGDPNMPYKCADCTSDSPAVDGEEEVGAPTGEVAN